MTGVCFVNEKMYLDERIQKIVLENFEGISFAGFQEGFGFYSKNKDKLKKSLSLNGSVMDENLRCYVDEPYSNRTPDNQDLPKIIEKNPTAIIGELEKGIMDCLADRYRNIHLTYTAYKDIWFHFLGMRIYKFWGDQRPFWDWMKKYKHRFSFCWIHLNQNNKQELIDYAGLRETWLYVPYETTADEFIKQFK